MKNLDLQTVSLMKDTQESEYEASWRKDLFSPEEQDEDKPEPVSADDDLPITVHAVGIGEQNPSQIGQEFSGITDRISKVKVHAVVSLEIRSYLSYGSNKIYVIWVKHKKIGRARSWTRFGTFSVCVAF